MIIRKSGAPTVPVSSDSTSDGMHVSPLGKGSRHRGETWLRMVSHGGGEANQATSFHIPNPALTLPLVRSLPRPAESSQLKLCG